MKRLSYRMIDGSGSSRRYPAGLRLRCSGHQSDLNKLWRWRSSFYTHLLNCLLHHLFNVYVFLTLVSSVGAVEDAVRDERLADASRTAARAFEFPWLTICNNRKYVHKFLSILYIFGQEFWLFSIHAKVKNKWRMRPLIGGRLCEAQQNEKLSICSCRLPNRSLPLD